MSQVDGFNQEAKAVKKAELSDAVFAIEPNQQAIYDAVLVYQAGLRQGTHSTKTRHFVSGTGKKPFRQKGTGYTVETWRYRFWTSSKRLQLQAEP